MKKVLKLIPYLLFAALVLWYFSHVTIKEILVTGVVIEHNVTADRYGDRTYSTIIKTDDGYIVEKVGLAYYAKPIGSRISYNKKELTWE